MKEANDRMSLCEKLTRFPNQWERRFLDEHWARKQAENALSNTQPAPKKGSEHT